MGMRFIDYKIKSHVLNADKKLLLNQTRLDKHWDFYFALKEYSDLVNKSFLNIYKYSVATELVEPVNLKKVFNKELEFYSERLKKSSELDELCEYTSELRGSLESLLIKSKSLKRISHEILYPKSDNPIIIKNKVRLLKDVKGSFNKEYKSLSIALIGVIRHKERELISLTSRVKSG